MGRRSGEPLGSAPCGQQMVSQSDLADAVSIFSGHAPASAQSNKDVGSLVLAESRLCNRVRRSDRLFLRLGGISLSRVRVFIFHWAASGGRAMDSGALHLRFRPGDVQLLWADQSSGIKHGLSQRAPRFAVSSMEQSAEAACDSARILRQPEVPLLMESPSLPVHF